MNLPLVVSHVVMSLSLSKHMLVMSAVEFASWLALSAVLTGAMVATRLAIKKGAAWVRWVLIGAAVLAACLEGVLPSRGLDPTARQIDVLALNGGDYVVHREPVTREP